MDKHLIVCGVFALVVMASSAPQHPEQHVEIVKQDTFITPDGYNFNFETSDGTSRQEQGTLKEISEDHKAIEVQGQYKYIAPDGLEYITIFTANEHGYQPQEHVQHPGQGQ